ncbi:MAG: hypothetical protein HPY30_11165 [Gammaproteobacteria bacterium (ex Lamellibrachia satsuma)]|nr:MAG: hypothetical protein HPY30_11165 [Gammaproteobacteria bacterium (ex Lamellibrachia satsuma)]
MNNKLKILCFIMSLLVPSISSADCYFGCDTIYRNLSTDYAKLIEGFKGSGFSVKQDNRNSKTLCNINDKNELEILYVERNTDNDVLITTYSQFSPPKTVGSTSWVQVSPGLWNIMKIQKTLNFGVMGITNNQSGDQRCTGGMVSGSKGEFGALVCVYGKHENLPVSLTRMRKEIGLSVFYALTETACE